MGLFDFVKDAAKTAGNYAQSQLGEVQNYKEQYDRLDDDALFRKFRNASGARKIACYQLLKERGFHPDN